MPLHVVPPSPVTLFEANVAAGVALGFLTPLSAQLDLALFGAFGLGSLQADLSAQFSAAIGINASLSLSVSNPLANFQAALAALVQLQASIELALSLGLPTVSLDIGAQITATAALSASLGIKIGGITALIEAALAIKLGAGMFMGELAAHLSAGPIDILSFGFDAPVTAADVGSQAAILFNGALPGILGTDQVSGVMILTKNPQAALAISALFKV